MMNKRFLLCLLAFFLYGSMAFSQAVQANAGVAGKGNNTHHSAALQDLNKGGYSIDPFTGTLNHQVVLGTVSTKSGLSFTSALSYSSSFTLGSTHKHLGGLPYGDNWSINTPMVKIKTENRNRYTRAEMESYNTNDLSCPNTPLYNIDGDCTTNSTDCSSTLEEGRVFWYSPTVSIPSIGSQRLVFKEFVTGKGFLFLPYTFESYFEAYLQVPANNTAPYWEVILTDGTVYTFEAQSIQHRSPINQRVQEECFTNVTIQKEMLANLFLPKSEYLEWYCTSISHPSKTDQIAFSYQKYGALEKLGNFSSGSAPSQINSYFYNGTKSNAGIEATYEKIILEEISSSTEKLDLNYNYLDEAYTSTFDGVQHPNDVPNNTGSSIYDNAFGKYVTYDMTQGGIGSSWYRYLHAKSKDYVDVPANVQVESINPYVFPAVVSQPTDLFVVRQPLTSVGTSSFDTWFNNMDGNFGEGGYLESEPINQSNFFAGDIYQMEFMVDDVGGLLDFGLFTGDFNAENTGLVAQIPNGDYEQIPSICYKRGFDQAISTTFQHAMKWNLPFAGQATANQVFTMPSLYGLYFENLRLKIGPSNSDTNFAYDWCGSDPNVDNPPSWKTYFNAIYQGNNDNPGNTQFYTMNSGASYPTNFGIGMPWFLLNDYYALNGSNLFNSLTNQTTNNATNYKFHWWRKNQSNTNDCQYNSRPLHLNDKAELENASLYRYAEFPYVLTSATKYALNESGTFVEQQEYSLTYGIESVTNTAVTRVRNPQGINLGTLIDANTGKDRHVVQLRRVTRSVDPLPNTINSPLATILPSQHFSYELKEYSSNVYHGAFFVMNEYTSPLGLTTSFAFNYPDFNGLVGMGIGIAGSTNAVFDPTTITPAPASGEALKSYITQNQSEDQMWYQNSMFGVSSTACSSSQILEPHNGLSYTIHMTVRETTQPDGNGINLTNYSYGNLTSRIYYSGLDANFVYGIGDIGNIQVGFLSSSVLLPTNGTANRPMIERTFGEGTNTGNHGLFFGKLLTEKSFTENSVLVSETTHTYDHIKIFNADWINTPPTTHPDFYATNRMYDAPYFFETRYATNMANLCSHFIKKTNTSTTEYIGGNSMTMNSAYDYFDADYTLSSTSPGIALITGGSPLTVLPSFQLYREVISSSDFIGVTSTTEYFPLYDFANSSVSTNPQVVQAISESNRSPVSQVRKTVTRNGSTHQQSTFREYYPTNLLLKAEYRQVQAGSGVGIINLSSGLPTTQKLQEITQYNATFQLPEIVTDLKGMHTTSVYHATNGNLSSVTITSDDTNLETLTTTYTYHTTDNRLQSETKPDGVAIGYTYDNLGRVMQMTRNSVLLESMVYSNFLNNLTSSYTDRCNQNFVQKTLYIDGSTSMVSKNILDCYGRSAATIVNGAYRTTNTVYDPYGRVLEIFPPSSNTAYAPASLGTISPQAFSYADFPLDNITTQADFTLALNSTNVRTSEKSIITDLTASSLVSTAGNTTSTPFLTGKYFLIESTDEDGKYVQSITDPFGNLVANISGNGTSALVRIVDERGNPLTIINGENQTTSCAFNYLNQKYESTTVDAGTSKYGYDPAGNLVFTETATMNTLAVFDGYGRNTTTAKTASTFSSFSSDNGNPWITSNTDYLTTQTNNNTLTERVFTQTHYTTPASTPAIPAQFSSSLTNTLANEGKPVQYLSFDESGNLITNTYLAYDADGFTNWMGCQMSADGVGSGTASDIYTSQNYAFTRNGLITSQSLDIGSDGSVEHTTSYTHDNRARLDEVSLTNPLLGVTNAMIADYTFDEVTNLIDQVEYFGTDASCGTNPIQTVDYTYNGRYRLTGMSSELYEETLYYDNTVVPGLSVSNAFNGNIKGASHKYNVNNINGITDDIWFVGQRTTGYLYDNFNRLVEVKSTTSKLDGTSPVSNLYTLSGDATFTYDKIGNLQSLDRLLPIPEDGQAMTQALTYTYDAGKNWLSSVDIVNNGNPNVSIPAGLPIDEVGLHNFTYNATGSIITDEKNAINPLTYDRLVYPTTLTNTEKNEVFNYRYDHGNKRISKQILDSNDNSQKALEYIIHDQLGRAISVIDDHNSINTFHLFGMDRIASVSPTSFCDAYQHLSLDGNEPIDKEYRALTIESIREIDPANDVSYIAQDTVTLNEEFCVPLGKEFLADIEPTDCTVLPPSPYAVVFTLKDHLGNVRMEFYGDCDGAVYNPVIENINDYHSFGALFWCYEKDNASKYQFTDKERDRESRYTYHGARYFDTTIGRFLSVDSQQDKMPNWSPYSGMFDNPIRFIDPDGNAPEDIIYRTVTNSDGSIKVYVTMNASLINLSSKTIYSGELERYAAELERSAKSTFSKRYLSGRHAGNKSISVDFSINIDVVKSISGIGDNDHVIVIVDDLGITDTPTDPGDHDAGLHIGGKAELDGNIMAVEWSKERKKTGVHEIGHLLGLEHVDDVSFNANHLMKKNGNKGYALNSSDLRGIFNRYSVGEGHILNSNQDALGTKSSKSTLLETLESFDAKYK